MHDVCTAAPFVYMQRGKSGELRYLLSGYASCESWRAIILSLYES